MIALNIPRSNNILHTESKAPRSNPAKIRKGRERRIPIVRRNGKWAAALRKCCPVECTGLGHRCADRRKPEAPPQLVAQGDLAPRVARMNFPGRTKSDHRRRLFDTSSPRSTMIRPMTFAIFFVIPTD